LVVASKEIGLEVNVDKTKHMVMSRDQNAGRSHSIKNDSSSFEKVEEFKCFETNMTVNLKIGFNNNFITSSSYIKFLVVTMDNTLSWNNHVDLLVKKLGTACYIIRNAKSYMSASSLKMIYYVFSFGYELWNYILVELVAQFYNF